MNLEVGEAPNQRRELARPRSTRAIFGGGLGSANLDVNWLRSTAEPTNIGKIFHDQSFH